MIAVVQIIKGATIYADGEFSGKCGRGLYILLGVEENDTSLDVDLLTAKIKKLRIFKDQNDKMNLSVMDIGGECAVVSNFTLCANYKHGNRPDYLRSAKPDVANSLYLLFIEKMSEDIPHVAHGCFGADMQTEMITDGPVTIVMDSAVLKKTTKEVPSK